MGSCRLMQKDINKADDDYDDEGNEWCFVVVSIGLRFHVVSSFPSPNKILVSIR